MEELNYDDIEYLRNFIPFKAFFDDLLPRYDEEFEVIGGILKREIPSFYIHFTEDMEELIDFLDGNGFEVEWTNRSRLSTRYHCIDVKPQYPPEPEPEPDMGEIIWFDSTITTTTDTTYIASFAYPTDNEVELIPRWYEYETLSNFAQKIIHELNATGRSPPEKD